MPIKTIKPGMTIGKLTAVRPLKKGRSWEFKCRCGNTCIVRKWRFLQGLRKSCGCRMFERPTVYTCMECGKKKSISEFYLRKNNNVYYRKCRKCHKLDAKVKSSERHKRLRVAVLAHYGGNPPVCACCGENVQEFLCVDHVDGDGKAHRKSIGTGSKFYHWLYKNGYPDKPRLRVLCLNCNGSLGSYGYCPHDRVITKQ